MIVMQHWPTGQLRFGAVSPRPRLDDAQQQSILDAAVRVIARRGADRTRLADIAREVGRSTGTLQHYFGSREELLVAAFHRLNQVAEVESSRLAAAVPDPWERLGTLVDFTLGVGDDWRDEWAVWLEFWSACARDPLLRQETTAVYGAWRMPIRAAIEEGHASGAFTLQAPVDEVVAAILAAMDGAALHALLGIGGLDRAAAREIVLRLASGYLGVPS